MSQTWEADNLVVVRSKNSGKYKRSFLRQVSCEFRFPTLLELGDDRPPASFVSSLRKEYPTLERANELTLGVGVGTTGTSHSHIFKSARQDWVVSLKTSSFSVEALSYSGFDEFKARAARVIAAASKIIDSDFFTRVGLRYINVLNVSDKDITRWINPDLVAATSQDKFIGVQSFTGKIQLGAPDGGCSLNHGAHPAIKSPNGPIEIDYVLDIDSWRNVVTTEDVSAAIDAVHSQAFDLFDWALGEDARAFLLSEPPKAIPAKLRR